MRSPRHTLLIAAIGVIALASIARSDESDPTSKEAARMVNAFALDLYGQLDRQAGNLFLSPYSVAMALTMTYAGADGETAAEMAEVLHVYPEVHEDLGAWLARFEETGSDLIRVDVANGLWARAGARFLDPFMDTVTHSYRAKLAEIDVLAPVEAAGQINGWVLDVTHGMIPELIPPSMITPATELILTNAIYFKGTWQLPFPGGRTASLPFTKLDGQTVQVPQMRRSGQLAYHETDELQMLELPYGTGEMTMIVLLPRETDGLPDLEASLTADRLAAWRSGLAERRVDVTLPKFRISYQARLVSALKELGMTRAFDRDADFSRMSERSLFIDEVIHKAVVEVNEKGTEAAAATGVGMTLSATPQSQTIFRADHAFCFLIVDRATGGILFMGRMADPSSAA